MSKVGRPASGRDPMAVTVLQASLLEQAAKAGVPVSAETAERVAGALVPFSAADLRVLEVVKDSPAVLNALARVADEDPDAFLRHVLSLLEFSKPKLARVENLHEGTALGVFVAVEQREPGPPPAIAGKVVSEGSK